MKKIGLYVHIPFCQRKCYYCDFCSYADQMDKQDEYVESILKEIQYKQNKSTFFIDTIYIGGGTPSIINEENIKKIVSKIKECYNIDKNAEITIEVNPGTINEKKLLVYKSIGINRLSIGLQSSNNKILNEIGRIHNYQQFEETYKMARIVGFTNINVDLMIGLPNQTMDDVNKSLFDIINKNPEHVSVYSLIVEEKTKMQKMIDDGKVKLPSEDLERAMYWNVKETLEKNGYNQYEISNFSKGGYESKHNSNCWKQHEYIGIGVAAHSYFEMKRFSNTCNVIEYINNIQQKKYQENITIHEIQNEKTMIKEYMILGLRMIDGVNVEEFTKKFSKNPRELFRKELEKLIQEELIIVDDENIKLSKRGLDFANIVWEEFC